MFSFNPTAPFTPTSSSSVFRPCFHSYRTTWAWRICVCFKTYTFAFESGTHVSFEREKLWENDRWPWSVTSLNAASLVETKGSTTLASFVGSANTVLLCILGFSCLSLKAKVFHGVDGQRCVFPCCFVRFTYVVFVTEENAFSRWRWMSSRSAPNYS